MDRRDWQYVFSIIRTVGALITSAANIYFIWHILRSSH